VAVVCDVFRIAVVQSPSGAAYRFIFANEVETPGFQSAAAKTVQSFRKLDASEVAKLKPLRVRIVTAAAGEGEDVFVRRMRGVSAPRDLFRVLNDLTAGARIAPGTKLKIISD